MAAPLLRLFSHIFHVSHNIVDTIGGVADMKLEISQRAASVKQPLFTTLFSNYVEFCNEHRNFMHKAFLFAARNNNNKKKSDQSRWARWQRCVHTAQYWNCMYILLQPAFRQKVSVDCTSG